MVVTRKSTLVGLLLLMTTLFNLPPVAARADFPNPIWSRSSIYDPGVTVFGNRYLVASGGGDRQGMLPIWTSTDRRNWTDSGRVIRAGHRPNTLMKAGAPQLYWFPETGRWHAYFGAVVQGHKKQCIGRAESTRPDDFDGNVPGAYLCAPKDDYSLIDPSIFMDQRDGQRYLLYKDNLDAVHLGPSRIVVRRIGRSGSLEARNLGPPHHVLTAAGGWEGTSVEAPTLVSRGGYFYLFYSGATYSDDHYAVGVARSLQPTGPFVRSPYNPILRALFDPRFCGSGHQDITYTPADGWLIFYHAYVAHGHGTRCAGARFLMMDQLHWDRPGGWPRVHDGTPSE